MLRLPRLLTQRHVCAALTLRFIAKTLWTRHKMLRLPHKSNTPHCKVLRLLRENDALALTRFQSIAPVTQNAKMTSHLVTLKRQNEHFVRDFRQISYVRRNLPNTSGSSPAWQSINDATTTPRRRHDDPPTTTRRHDDTTPRRPTPREHRSNPRPQL